MASLGVIIVTVATVKQKADELARGKEHLQIIGKALRNFQVINQHFPMGTVPNKSLPPERRLSWLASLASHWEIGGLHDAINWSEEWNSQRNVLLVETNYLTDYRPYPGDKLRRGLSPYVGIADVGKNAAHLPENHPRTGAFGYDRLTSARDFKDGLSTTMIVAETSQSNGPWIAGGSATVRGLDPGHLPYIGNKCQFGGVRGDGALALMGDGSVRLVSKSIDPKVYEALSTISGGENIYLEINRRPGGVVGSARRPARPCAPSGRWAGVSGTSTSGRSASEARGPRS